jgi:hypothetical protein
VLLAEILALAFGEWWRGTRNETAYSENLWVESKEHTQTETLLPHFAKM